MSDPKRPRDHRGRFVPIDCPSANCGAGRLEYDGDRLWRCDGLADPGHADLPLTECPHLHWDGEPYKATP